MLNYAFPYDRSGLQEQFSALGRLLADALNAHSDTERQARLASYLSARRQFQEALSLADYRYLSFQLWQEGVARYTEYVVAKFAAEHYHPRRKFRELKDYVSFQPHADQLRSTIITQLQTEKLSTAKRLVVYPFGGRRRSAPRCGESLLARSLFRGQV